MCKHSKLCGGLATKHSREGVEPNNMLNYGYTLLRAAVARALMGSGLFPAFGIFHRNRYNAFPLADDIMEPYRPYVDEIVYTLYTNGEQELNKDVKAQILNLLFTDTIFGKITKPLEVGLTTTTASLAKCFNLRLYFVYLLFQLYKPIYAMSQTHKRYAFISYNHKDAKWAKWLQRKLESYKLPSEIHNEFEESNYLRPIFRDKTDLNTGVLANELRLELECSKYLIVICSPNSAKSQWVSDEIKAFIEMGRIEYIIPFIVDGTPHNYKEKDINVPPVDECFPFALRALAKEQPELELLGINIKEAGKEAAFIKVVSKILGLSFDVLWERNKRQQRKKLILRVIGATIIVFAMCFIWIRNQPFDINISLHEEHQYANLEYVDGYVSMRLENDTLSGSVINLQTLVVFKNIPSKYRGKRVQFTFCGFGYKPVDTLIMLSSEVKISICRDSDTYGLIKGVVKDYNDMPVKNVYIQVLDYSSESGSDGGFEINIPLKDQQPSSSGYMAKVKYKNVETECVVYPNCNNGIKNDIYIETK